MPYQGPYQGQYAGFSAYGHAQQQTPQYHPGGMQYPVQQQAMQPIPHQSIYQPPMNVDMYSKQYYQPQQAHQQQQQQQQEQAPQQYIPQYAPYQGNQHQTPQRPRTEQYPPYMNPNPQLPQSRPNPPPALPQGSPLQQYPFAQQQHPQFQQARSQSSSQWHQPPPPLRPVQVATNNSNVGRPASVQTQRHPAPHVSRSDHSAPSPVVLAPNERSSPDPLAPSPAPRQARPQRPEPQQQQQQQQQSRSNLAPVSAKPKANRILTPHTPQHRIASHVEIPVMSQPAKRRRSNEGQPIPVCEAPSVDYQTVLLALSDEYVAAAYSLQDIDTDAQLERYHALMATGMGCLESVLANYRQPDARREARIRLRLATLLVEETENEEEAEEALSKGIALCERSRLTDLKYAMHHLLARLMFKKSPKAALKATEKLVQEVEALHLLHWTYAFRLLRVCLGLQIPSPSETGAILKQLTAMSNSAERYRHVSMQITASTIEALVHMRSGTPDAVNLAQRAMATARTHQLGSEMEKMPQVRALLDCLDLSCSLVNFDPVQSIAKMNQMHQSMDPTTRQPGWSKDGTVDIDMIPTSNADLELDTSGIMKTNANGTAALALRWMDQSAVYVIGYVLSGITYLHRQGGDEQKAASFLKEGLKLNKKSALTESQPQSLHGRSVASEQQVALDTAARLLIILDACSRFDWRVAQQGIALTREKLLQRGSEMSDDTARMLLYLDAMCKQATGDLEGALQIYRSPALAFEPDVKLDSVEKDIRVLSALNSIMMLRTLRPEDVTKANNLQAAIEPHCINHGNNSFKAAYYTTKAIADGSKHTIIKTKQYLQFAVSAAKGAANNQLLFMVMNAMTDLFFHGIIGEQAEKSAQAGRSLAKKGNNRLWLCVADSMYGDIKERCGKTAEADAARKEGAKLLMDLPDSLKRNLTLPANDGAQ